MSEQDAVQYSYINNGANPVSVKISSQYSYVNNGVLQTRDDGATGYNYIDVIEPPSQLWMSDGSDWFHVVLDYEMEEAIKVSEDNTGMFIGQMISDQGLPTGGSAGQVLKKLSDDNYDAVWATDSGGGSGGGSLPAGGEPGEVLSKSSSLDGDVAWMAPVPDGGSEGQILAKASGISRDVEWIDPPSGGGSVGGLGVLWELGYPFDGSTAQTQQAKGCRARVQTYATVTHARHFLSASVSAGRSYKLGVYRLDSSGSIQEVVQEVEYLGVLGSSVIEADMDAELNPGQWYAFLATDNTGASMPSNYGGGVVWPGTGIGSVSGVRVASNPSVGVIVNQNITDVYSFQIDVILHGPQ